MTHQHPSCGSLRGLGIAPELSPQHVDGEVTATSGFGEIPTIHSAYCYHYCSFNYKKQR